MDEVSTKHWQKTEYLFVGETWVLWQTQIMPIIVFIFGIGGVVLLLSFVTWILDCLFFHYTITKWFFTTLFSCLAIGSGIFGNILTTSMEEHNPAIIKQEADADARQKVKDDRLAEIVAFAKRTCAKRHGYEEHSASEFNARITFRCNDTSDIRLWSPTQIPKAGSELHDIDYEDPFDISHPYQHVWHHLP